MNIAPAVENNDLAQKLKRDLNCLTDPDRRLRKKALLKLQSTLLGEDKDKSEPSSKVISDFFHQHAQGPLLSSCKDEVENCREKSLSLLISMVEQDCIDPNVFIGPLVDLLGERIGVYPYLEPAEEIRLLLLELFKTVLEKCSVLNPKVDMETLAEVFSKAVVDPFPESKRTCCACLILYCAYAPALVKYHVETILSALVQNLSHQHSKVRLVTLQVCYI